MRRIPILCGNGGVFLHFELARGADGAMTGFSFPEILVRMCRLQVSSDYSKMRALFDIHLPLMRYEQQPGIGLAVRKYFLRRRGLLTSDTQRAPATKLSADARGEVDALVADVLKRGPAIKFDARG